MSCSPVIFFLILPLVEKSVLVHVYVQVGTQSPLRKVGTQLVPMTDSTTLVRQGKQAEARQRLEEDGFLMVRGVLGTADLVQTDSGKMVHPKSASGWVVDVASGEMVTGKGAWVWKNLPDVCTHPSLLQFYQFLFGKKEFAAQEQEGEEEKEVAAQEQEEKEKAFVVDPCTSWARIKGRHEPTVEHADLYYFLRQTDFLTRASTTDPNEEKKKHKKTTQTLLTQPCPCYTTWICLSSLPSAAEGGSVLCVVPGSHRWEGFERSIESGKQLPATFDKETRASTVWHTVLSPGLEPGDVILFNLKTIHASTRNDSDCFRVSLDTRVKVSE